ncbi:S-adenosyl-L-methionine-dependent methyltransferase [Cubamyces menziesii]|nr:S-adenosyl-L-methionine-dependent methyltransferase [Cubamyces menziesii]
MSSLATLRALHATIGNALEDIERIYSAKDLDYPSLDAPFYPSKQKSKQADAEKLATDPKVMQASSLIVAACGQLSASVHHPFLTAAVEGVQLGHISAALSVLEATHTVEILRDAGPQGLHINDLARKVEQIRLGANAASKSDVEHLDPVKLGHILRLLATQHILREVQPNVFTNNRLSSILDTGKSLELLTSEPAKKYDDTNGASAFIAMSSCELFRAITYLNEWLLPSSDLSKKKADTPFNLALKTDEQYYSWLERPENAFRLMQVSRAMAAASVMEGTNSIANLTVLSWESLPQGSVVVDVGGGVGSVSIQLATPYPNLRLIVQDRAQTIELAPKIWGDTHKDLFDSGRVSFQAQDFFEPQPPSLEVPGVGQVQHPAAYIITRIMHNWPDAQCKQILRNLRAAAGPETKLILHEIVLPLACQDTSSDTNENRGTGTTAPVDSPLLPNLGKAAICGYLVDLTMMAMMNSRERTLEEMRELALDAGWKIVSVDLCSLPIAWGYLVAIPV